MASSNSSSALPTIGQLEREISQRIRAFYREHLGQQPGKVSCQLFGMKLALVLEDTVTKPEKVLAQQGKDELAEQVRSDLDQILQPQLKVLIEKILSVEVVDILSDSTLETGRAGIIVILAEEPQFRPKNGKK